DGKSVGAVVTLAPPAVEDAEVQATMAAGFHAAGAGCFERSARIVQPDIAARYHLPGDMDIIIFHKHHGPRQFTVFADMDNLLDEPLALVIARVRLARKNELHRPLLVAREFHDVVELL